MVLGFMQLRSSVLNNNPAINPDRMMIMTDHLEDSTLKLDSQDPTGAVLSGSLVLRSSFLKGVIGTYELGIDFEMSHIGFRALVLSWRLE